MTEYTESIRALIDAGKWIMDSHLTWGSAGNMSVRPCESHMLITASGTRFDSLTPEDFTRFAFADGSCEGGKPSKELPVHRAIYEAVPWARAVIHASPFYTTLAASSDLPVPANLFVEDMYYLQRVGRVPYSHPGSLELARAVGEAAKRANVILMENHGVILYDASLCEARTALEVLENVCRMSLCAKQSGLQLNALPPETVRDFLMNSGYRKPRAW